MKIEIVQIDSLDKITVRICKCLNAGQDDGDTTCWRHHDCTLGYCTHIDGDE